VMPDHALTYWNTISGERQDVQRGYANLRDQLAALKKNAGLGRLSSLEIARELKDCRGQRMVLDRQFGQWERAVASIANVELGPEDDEGNRPEDWKPEDYEASVFSRFPAVAERVRAGVLIDQYGSTDEVLNRAVPKFRDDRPPAY